ncbi:MAG: TolC family protein, partial [Candidatus Omnitrophica bacterium]|nr:TolC family protein [Candidatus Omnitrophota bacterium]
IVILFIFSAVCFYNSPGNAGAADSRRDLSKKKKDAACSNRGEDFKFDPGSGPVKRLELDINQVSSLGLKNNFDIQIFKLDNSIGQEELLKAQNVYDTSLDFSYKYEENKLKRASTLLGKRTVAVTEDLTLSKQLLSGTVLSLSTAHSRDTTDSSSSIFNPAHEVSAGVSITQPLGKNAWGVIDNNTVQITKLDTANTGYTSQDKIEIELANIQKIYWNLLLAQKELELAEEVSESAAQLYKTNKRNFKMGILEAPEFYATEANLKEKQQELVIAQARFKNALSALRYRLNLNMDVLITPKDEFDLKQKQAGFEDMVRTALAKRRDYKKAKNIIKQKDLYAAMKKSSLWPQIDLTASFTRNGLDSRFADSISEITSEEYPEYTVGVIFSFPLENSAARAEYSQKQLEQAKALIGLKKTECLILVQVHDAFIDLMSRRDSVDLLEQAKELQHKKYLGEADRFKKGRSDTDRFIRYQNDYLRAKLVYLRSLYKYQEAAIDLKLITNTLLEEIVKN